MTLRLLWKSACLCVPFRDLMQLNSLVDGLFLLLLTVMLASAVMAATAWRQTKQSFHLYNRRAAEIRMQNYLTVTAILLMGILLVGGYRWLDDRSAALSAENDDAEARFQSALSIATLLNANATREAEIALLAAAPPTPDPGPAVLPLEYRSADSQAPLDEDAELTRIRFATALSETYAPANPANQFSTEIDTLYATFNYRNLSNGLEWAWVWRRDGEVIEGGNAIWTYGSSGAAFVFLDPDAFEPGDYTAEIWLNETLFARGSVDIFQSAANATIATNGERTLLVTTPELANPLNGIIGRLPVEYRQLQPQAPITSQTEMELVDFGVEYGGESQPVTLLAAFEHQAMAEGMVWSWVWRRDNNIIGGGSRIWREPSDARVGFMHLIPAAALQSGEYSVELWVNETLLSRAVVQITTSLESP